MMDDKDIEEYHNIGQITMVMAKQIKQKINTQTIS